MDKCLPFGSSISCAIFQDVSDAIAYLVYVRTLKRNVNYLDDYLFVSLLLRECNKQVQTFLSICDMINFPVSMEKTFWGTTRLTFLGMLLDSEHQVICIPEDKVCKALGRYCLPTELQQKESDSKAAATTMWTTQFFMSLCSTRTRIH